MSISKLPPWAFLVLAFAPIPFVLLVPRGLPEPVNLGLALAIVIWGLAMAVLHWRRLDEPARAAHRTAWYCGGSIGLGVAMLAAVAVFMTPTFSNTFDSWVTATAHGRWPASALAFWYGTAFAGLAQGACFLLAWMAWWLAKR